MPTPIAPDDLDRIAADLARHAGTLREAVKAVRRELDSPRPVDDDTLQWLGRLTDTITTIERLIAALGGTFIEQRAVAFFRQVAPLIERVRAWADLDAAQVAELKRLSRRDYSVLPEPLADFNDLSDRTREWAYALDEFSATLGEVGKTSRRADSAAPDTSGGSLAFGVGEMEVSDADVDEALARLQVIGGSAEPSDAPEGIYGHAYAGVRERQVGPDDADTDSDEPAPPPPDAERAKKRAEKDESAPPEAKPGRQAGGIEAAKVEAAEKGFGFTQDVPMPGAGRNRVAEDWTLLEHPAAEEQAPARPPQVSTERLVQAAMEVWKERAAEALEKGLLPPPPPSVSAVQGLSTDLSADRPRSVPTPSRFIDPGAVTFSVHHRQEMPHGEWTPLLAYVFRASAALAVMDDVRAKLGRERTKYGRAVQPSKQAIPEGAPVTATPHMDGFQFNPLSVTVGFYDDWHRFDFQMRAKDAPPDQFSTGAITFTAEGVIVADVAFSVFTGAPAADEADDLTMAARGMYEAVFCSYSHRDTQVVERVERVCRALGIDYLRDVTTLKAGQHWDEELLRLIDRADIFQLFWSPSAAESAFVEKEWRHALRLEGERAAFIRPVYWSQPMPAPPPELAHIHFAYHPELGA